MRVIGKFIVNGETMVTMTYRGNALVMTEREYKWIVNNERNNNRRLVSKF